jgi:EAL domain-containing protein (putative c-di-GMP-specific phosphodiesterase class I)
MKRLREAGCGVALDDFGTGTNSLVYLRDFPVTRVKVDGRLRSISLEI